MAGPPGPVLSETEGAGETLLNVLPEMGKHFSEDPLWATSGDLALTDPTLGRISRGKSESRGDTPYLE